MTDPWMVPAEPEPKAKGKTKWPRDYFAEAVWADPELKAVQKLVALAFADHAKSGVVTFVPLPRLMARTHLSRTAVRTAIAHLQDHGWLDLRRRAHQNYAARYAIKVPAANPLSMLFAQSVATLPPEEASGSPYDTLDSPRGSRDDARGSRDVTSGSPDDPDLTNDYKHDLNARASEDASPEPDPWVVAQPALQLSDADRAAAEDRARELGLHIDVVSAAVAKLRATKGDALASMGAYLVKVDKPGIERLAGVESASAKKKPAIVEDRGPTCGLRTHVKGGMRIHGTGVNASRVCPSCQEKYPAADEVAPVQAPAPVSMGTEEAS